MLRLSLHRASVRAAGVAALAAACVVGVLGADVALSQREADAFARKVLAIQHYATTQLTGARLTPVSEAELNSYIRFSLTSEIPVGVVEPYVTIVGNGDVRGRAIVDLDLVRKAKTRGWLDPLAYITGRVPVTAAGRVVAQDGQARFELAEATVSGLSVPKSVLQELLSFYSRSPQNPNGVSLDDPIELPARIREIHVEAGKAILVQK